MRIFNRGGRAIIGIGDYYAFRNRYAVMGGYRDPKSGRPMQVVGYQNMEELATTVAPYVFEVRKEDVLEVMPPQYEVHTIKLTKEQRALYDEVKRNGEYTHGDATHTVKNVLELALRLQQVTGGFVTTYTEEKQLSGKVKRIANVAEVVPWKRNPKILELLDVCEEQEQIVIWAMYRAEIAAICEALRATFPKELVREFHGGVTEADRDAYKADFQQGRARFLVGNTQTGGEGLKLSACGIMCFFNNSEKMIDRQQAEDRPVFDGMKRSVTYVDLVAEKTVDVTIIKSIKAKLDLSEYVRKRIKNASELLTGEE